MEKPPRINAGIFLGKSDAQVSVLRMGWRGQYKRYYSKQMGAEGDMWEKDSPDLGKTISKLFAGLPGKAKRADVRVCVSLPDPLVRETVFVFDDFPAHPAEARKLIAWRMAQDMDVPSDTLRCSFQVGLKDTDGIRVIGRSLETWVFVALQNAMRQQGIRMTRLDGWSGYHFNQRGDNDNGISFWSNDDWWKLDCWHSETKSNMVVSGWISNTKAHSRIADRALRLAKTFALKHMGGATYISVESIADLTKALRAKSENDDLVTVVDKGMKRNSEFDLSVLVATP